MLNVQTCWIIVFAFSVDVERRDKALLIETVSISSVLMLGFDCELSGCALGWNVSHTTIVMCQALIVSVYYHISFWYFCTSLCMEEQQKIIKSIYWLIAFHTCTVFAVTTSYIWIIWKFQYSYKIVYLWIDMLISVQKWDD